MLSMATAWSPCPWRGSRGRSVLSMATAWSPCPWHGLRARGVVSVSVVWWCVRGVVSVSTAWSPWPQHGLWPCLAFAASPLVYLPPTCRWMFSLVKIGLQSKSSHTAPGTDIDCTDLTPCSKFLEVASWARGVHVLDSFDSHSPTTLQRGHTLSSFSLSVYLRAVCPKGVRRADPWGTKG